MSASQDTSTPVIYDRKPVRVELAPGTYYWCACGKSTNQPFCNGAHAGSGISPQKVEVTEPKTIAFCNCKHSMLGYQCDGTHKNLPADA
ncbi:MAG: CDGSH iron-sulfur domain-containing protein [Vampirovibrionales bacterium]|nr:CDGSH iron-sulfur domain-containing protein [Vampirovibrionales bacterium]